MKISQSLFFSIALFMFRIANGDNEFEDEGVRIVSAELDEKVVEPFEAVMDEVADQKQLEEELDDKYPFMHPHPRRRRRRYRYPSWHYGHPDWYDPNYHTCPDHCYDHPNHSYCRYCYWNW